MPSTQTFAAVVLAAAGLVAAACGARATTPSPPANSVASAPGPLAAEPGLPPGVTAGALWTCVIDDYPAQPCKFHQDGGQWRLTKLLGSQRFDGAVSFSAGAIRVVGQFFCPWGDCTVAIDTAFVPDGPAAANQYTAVVDGSTIGLRWDEANAAEYGGAGYGGLTGQER